MTMHHLSERFSVRCAKSLDDLQWLTRPLMSNWVRPANEAKWYFTAGLTSSFYIGEVDGKRVSSISFVKHSKLMGFASGYFVEKAYRGKGYGIKTLQAVYTPDILKTHKLYGYAVPHLQDFYYKNLGLKPGWSIRRYKISLSILREVLTNCKSAHLDTQILQVNQANLEDLMEYSADMIASSETSKPLLSAMLTHSWRSSWVALSNNGNIVGYLVMSKTINNFPESGYLIRPLFANNGAIAYNLLRVAAKYAAEDTVSNGAASTISLDTSMLNLEGIEMMENQLQAEIVDDRIFMGSKGIPLRAHEKIFSAASFDAM